MHLIISKYILVGIIFYVYIRKMLYHYFSVVFIASSSTVLISTVESRISVYDLQKTKHQSYDEIRGLFR